MSKKKPNLFWSRTRRRLLQHPKLIRGTVLIILLLFIAFLIYLLFPVIKTVVKKTVAGPRMAYSLITADTSSLDQFNDRTNILVLGTGGEKHKEVELTDTLVFISIDTKTADVVMLSIPRDIWIDSLKTKINAVYYYGEKKQEGGGFVLVKDAVYQILDQPIHYAALIDFQGFVNLVDLLGGIEVKIDRDFDDYQYPIPGRENDDCGGDPDYRCRYEHIHFEAGRQHMDGRTALKFVRSRNAEGEEGTDFARSQRQQKVIMAVAKKLFSYKFLTSPKKIVELRKFFGDHIKLDSQLSQDQITAFMSLFISFIKNQKEIRTISLDTGSDENPGFLYNPPLEEYDQWVLLPRAGDWQKIQKYVQEKIYKRY